MKKIIAIRKKKGISQAYLAKLTGISRYRISELECGYRELTPAEKGLMLGVLTNQPDLEFEELKGGSREESTYSK